MSTFPAQNIRKLFWGGFALLIAGIVLHGAAEPFSRKLISRSANGSSWTVDEDRMRIFIHAGDTLSWLGVGLILVGANAWVKRNDVNLEPRQKA